MIPIHRLLARIRHDADFGANLGADAALVRSGPFTPLGPTGMTTPPLQAMTDELRPRKPLAVATRDECTRVSSSVPR